MSDINWKVGDTLVYENALNQGETKIVRETPTTFVLKNGYKIKKGRRYPMGEHGYGVPSYYSTNEPEGQKTLERMIRHSRICKLSRFDWKKLSDEKIDLILKILEEKQNEKEQNG